MDMDFVAIYAGNVANVANESFGRSIQQVCARVTNRIWWVVRARAVLCHLYLAPH